MKLRGWVDDIARRGVRGWAVDLEDPERRLQLLIRIDGEVAAQATADKPRPALRESLGGNVSGNHGFSVNFEPPLSAFSSIEVEIIEQSTGQLLPNGSRQLKGMDRRNAPLRPVMVTSTGRSGTTLLMSELLRHPRVAVADRYAYEIKLLSYYAAALKVLGGEMDRVNSTNPDNIFDRIGQYRIGHNPFNGVGFYNIVKNKAAMARLFEETIPASYANLFRQFIEQYYELVRIDQNKPEAIYFAEKVDLDEAARNGGRVMFGEVREIALVRDPRDFFSSAKSFWKLESRQALDMIKTTIPRLQAVAQSTSSDIMALRYEDLVQRPRDAKARLYKFLGLRDDDDSEVVGDVSLFGRHGTSKDVGSSIGRWREDLTPEEVAAVNEAFASYIEVFEYERS